MTASGASLFVNGDTSVRITRITFAEGLTILSVLGPGGGTAVYTCASERDCAEKEGEIESALRATGYSPFHASERRRDPDRRRFPRGDRRRQLRASQ
jgi:hypothetical protein